MKTIIFGVLALCVAVMGKDASSAVPAHMLSMNQREVLRGYKVACIEETGVELSAVENFRLGMFDENDTKLSCFGACMLRKIGILTEEGKLNDLLAMDKLSSVVAPATIEKIFSTCGDIHGETLCKTGLNIMKCFKANNFFNVI